MVKQQAGRISFHELLLDVADGTLDDQHINWLGTTQNIKFTALGGIAVKLTNKQGAAVPVGSVVEANGANPASFDLADANELSAIGVAEATIADNATGFIVVAGIADILADAGGWTAGDRIIAGATPGAGTANNAPAVAVHFQEIGHAIENAAGGALGRVVIHFL